MIKSASCASLKIKPGLRIQVKCWMQWHRSKSCGMLAVETGVWQNPERHCFNKVGTDSTCMCPHTKSAKQKSPRPQHLLLTLQGQVSTEKSSIHILQEHQALLGGDTQQMVEPVI